VLVNLDQGGAGTGDKVIISAFEPELVEVV
jgi:hypothetical protein